jgi:hypothetical protein
MTALNLPGTQISPSVRMSASTGKLSIEGRSLPEHVGHFYAPVLAWLEEYREEPHSSTDLLVHLEYYNSGTSAVLYKVLALLQGLPNVKVEWYFDPEDEDLRDAGKELCELLHIPFSLIPTETVTRI